MYYLTIHSHFAAAHNLINYQGECENLHGHNWKVEVTVKTRILNEAGLGMDFKDLKATVKQILGELDHVYLNQLDFFKTRSPSSENLARYIFDKIAKQLKGTDVEVDLVKVWESENACAAYTCD